MTDFSTDVVIRQTLRSFVHELAMGVLASKEDGGRKPIFQKQTENLLRSPNFLKMLYESPTDHIGKILNTMVCLKDTYDLLGLSCFCYSPLKEILHQKIMI